MNTRRQFHGCIYFTYLSGNGLKCCHHLLMTGRRREVTESGLCLSREVKKRKGENVERDQGL